MATKKIPEDKNDIVVDISIDSNSRPLTSADLRQFLLSKKMDRTQAISTFGFSTLKAFNDLLSEPNKPLPFEMEMLLRLLMNEPTPPISLRQPKDVFNLIYKGLLDEYQDPEEHEAARVLLYERFTGMFDRHVTSAYRWLKISGSGKHGEANATIRRIFSELEHSPETVRETLEHLARETHRCRGVDFDTAYPLPSTTEPPVRRRPGPKALKPVVEAPAARTKGAPPAPKHGVRIDRAMVDPGPNADSPRRKDWLENRAKLAVLSVTIAALRLHEQERPVLIGQVKKFFNNKDRNAAMIAMVRARQIDADSVHILNRFIEGSTAAANLKLAACLEELIEVPGNIVANEQVIKLLTEGLLAIG